jgi:hypothetical protein
LNEGVGDRVRFNPWDFHNSSNFFDQLNNHILPLADCTVQATTLLTTSVDTVEALYCRIVCIKINTACGMISCTRKSEVYLLTCSFLRITRSTGEQILGLVHQSETNSTHQSFIYKAMHLSMPL